MILTCPREPGTPHVGNVMGCPSWFPPVAESKIRLMSAIFFGNRGQAVTALLTDVTD